MTRRSGIKAEDDANLKAIIKSRVKYITIVGKTWDLHVKDVLKTSTDENLNMIRDSIEYLVKSGLTVFYDAEHFFDAYEANKEYSLQCLK
jgi:2-isopropylmalate synthase